MTTQIQHNPFEFWDEAELAGRLGISVRTVRNWRMRRAGPDWIKLGGAVRYRPASVARWLAGSERQVTKSS